MKTTQEHQGEVDGHERQIEQSVDLRALNHDSLRVNPSPGILIHAQPADQCGTYLMVGAPRAGVLGIVGRIVETFGRTTVVRQHAVRQLKQDLARVRLYR